MDNLWVQAGLIVLAQIAIATGDFYRNHKRQESHKEKMMTVLAVKYGVETSELDSEMEKSPELALRYTMDFLSHERWENRFANFVGLLVKPIAFIAGLMSWCQILLPILVLTGDLSGSDAVMGGWIATGILAAWTVTFALIDVITYAICGRGLGAPARDQKTFAETWDRYLKDKKFAERAELDSLDWELSEA